MTVEINIAYEGSLRCHATHAPSGGTLQTDAPLDNCGKGETFSPTDLVATALGSCMLTIMGIVAERHAIDLSEVEVRVEKHMSTDAVRRIVQLPVWITGPSCLSEKERKLLETAALSCPVHKSLGDSIDRSVSFSWSKSRKAH
ncbi:MAG: osmotically inducible protein OsmC [Planctomycetes bacterium]|mgnify:FL=1|jgi:uncharacterized OsmC-like protein|nr:osmotically inducible protein OsmC [Planctomycetota bacterium]MDP7245654.1 OsmC family protein [Planctomycetota bacterium]MDP7560006.1 OsmC family protein [Planctomycetota bacterium]|tara:strand:+ start:16616 stop:17044 length:429 start_codon:yes stop_codon:yes gene_type:complete